MEKLFTCRNCHYTETNNESQKYCPKCTKSGQLFILEKLKVEFDYIYGEIETEEGKFKYRSSIEAEQDLMVFKEQTQKYSSEEPTEEEIKVWNQIYEGLFGRVRTPDLTNEEILDWKYYDNFFSNLDLDKVREKYKMTKIRDEDDFE